MTFADLVLSGLTFGFSCAVGVLLGAALWRFLFVNPPQAWIDAVNATRDAFAWVGDAVVIIARRATGRTEGR